MQLNPIGVVRSCYPDKFGTPRQPGLAPSSRAFLKLNPEVQPEISLEGLEGYSHLWVIFIFHKNNSARFHAKVHPPRLDGDNIGVFSTRSPHRPNPIGLSLVEIENVEKDGVWVRGVDLIDGTPILDIKPYLPAVEAIPHAKSGWAEKPARQITVTWQSAALETLSQLSLKTAKENGVTFDEIKNLIEETIQNDPRPVIYRGMSGEESPYRQSHAFYVYDLDVHFSFVTDSEARIENVFIAKK